MPGRSQRMRTATNLSDEHTRHGRHGATACALNRQRPSSSTLQSKIPYDVFIVGGGIVGCAIARELTRYRLGVALGKGSRSRLRHQQGQQRHYPRRPPRRSNHAQGPAGMGRQPAWDELAPISALALPRRRAHRCAPPQSESLSRQAPAPSCSERHPRRRALGHASRSCARNRPSPRT